MASKDQPARVATLKSIRKVMFVGCHQDDDGDWFVVTFRANGSPIQYIAAGLSRRAALRLIQQTIQELP